MYERSDDIPSGFRPERFAHQANRVYVLESGEKEHGWEQEIILPLGINQREEQKPQPHSGEESADLCDFLHFPVVWKVPGAHEELHVSRHQRESNHRERAQAHNVCRRAPGAYSRKLWHG
jgi:hypothetical protein